MAKAALSKLEQLRAMRETPTKKSRKPRPPKRPKEKISVIAEARAKAKAGNGERGAKTLAVAELLKRAKGCTNSDVKQATGWQSISMPKMAENLGIKLRIEKKPGEPTRYFGA